MDGFGLRFHHFGLAVLEPSAAFRFLTAMGYADGAAVFDPLQNVYVAIRHHPLMPDVEVVWPKERGSPIDRMLQRGHMIYHLCYVTDDAERTLAAMEAAGLTIMPLGEPKPALLFGGTPVSFHTIDQVGMIELIHGEPAAGRLKSPAGTGQNAL